MKTQMKAKNLMVSLFTIASVLFLVATVSAAEPLAEYDDIYFEIDSIPAYADISVVAGETITLEVWFTSAVNTSNVRVKAEIEGEKIDFNDVSSPFDVEAGFTYHKVLHLKVPYELRDVLSDDAELTIKAWNGDYKTENTQDITLRVQRPSYNANVMSVNVPQTISAGDVIPVDVVLKNRGYNDLDDLYVTAKIPALSLERTSYFGDIVAIECDDDYDAVENYGVDITRKCNEDDADTINGRLYLTVPYDAASGIYTLEVDVTNSDTTSSVVKQVIVDNDFSETVMVSSVRKTASVGQDAEFDLLIVNPTNKLKVYRIVPESSGSVSSSTSMAVVAVPAGASKTVTVTASADSKGEYNFNVNVLSGESVVGTVALTLNAEGRSISGSPIVVLTVILAIIFLVLLVVLIVLISKKPSQTEEFGESYY